jgi:hypothetical protein
VKNDACFAATRSGAERLKCTRAPRTAARSAPRRGEKSVQKRIVHLNPINSMNFFGFASRNWRDLAQ